MSNNNLRAFPKDEPADVVIVGGGPIGLALALSLGGRALKRPLRSIVLEARDPHSFLKQGHDTRGSALSLATQSMFRALDLWDRLGPEIQEMRNIKVTDGRGSHSARPALLGFATTDGEQAAAGLVENRVIAEALLQEVEASPEITLRPLTALSSLIIKPGTCEIGLSNGGSINAALIIGADGRNSVVRPLAGISVRNKSYGQTALSFSISHSHSHGACAEEHFSPDGVFALLPLKNNRSSIVWATSAAEASRLMGLVDAEFEAELAAKMGEHLGTVRIASPRQAYPLILQVAEHCIANRVALVGDAAHVIHPLAGLGLNLGFKDAAALAEAIHDAVARGEDHGGPAVLERYRRWRNFDTSATLAMIDGLNRLFANDDPTLRLLRGLGLQGMNRMAAAKSLFMTEAAGLLGDIPKLMRGVLPA